MKTLFRSEDFPDGIEVEALEITQLPTEVHMMLKLPDTKKSKGNFECTFKIHDLKDEPQKIEEKKESK